MDNGYDPILDIFASCNCGWGGSPAECSPVEIADSSGDYPAAFTISCPECGSICDPSPDSGSI